jgi:DNA polymerase-1
MSEKKKLFLVDAYAFIYRAHFAFIRNPRINSKGLNTSAIFGFVNSLLEILEKEKPTHIAVAFDSKGPTVRVADFTEYKANREKQPDEITVSIPIIKKILDALKITMLEVPGYEADDIVATISKKAQKDEYDVFMYTPDKDYAQLVTDNVFLYKPSRKDKPSEIWDVQKVLDEFGIKRTEQVIEIQGLMGDSVDNIPGVPGIGPKTAQKLIAEFDNIENLLANTDKLKGKIKESLENNAENARISRQLAELITDAPVEIEEEKFIRQQPDEELLEQIFAELEFRNLSKRIFGREAKKTEKKEIKEEVADLFSGIQEEKEEVKSLSELEIDYKEITEFEEVKGLFSNNKTLAVYFDFSSNDYFSASLKSIAIAIQKNQAFYFKTQEIDIQKIAELFTENHEVYGYDLKFPILFFKNAGFEINPEIFDVQLAHYIIDSENKHDLDLISEIYLNYQTSQSQQDASEIKDFHCEKADVIFQFAEVFQKEIDENKFNEVFEKVEQPLTQVLADMEFAGVKVDKKVLNDYSKELEEDLNKVEKEIHKISGVSFNVNSAQQLGHVLFEIMKLDPKAKKTKKSKQYSTSEDVLVKLKDKHEIANLVLDYRGIQKLKSTYIDALPQLINEKTGKIHTTFDQVVAATGRLSSKNPNLQNIPIRTERGRYTRKAFIPTSIENTLISADYSQIELRVIAHTSQDENMVEAFNDNLDIHTATAARVFKVGLEDVNSDMRRKAKEVNFGIIYGISSWGLAQRLGIPRSEGAEIKENYFKSYPKIKEYIDACIQQAREKGYAETIFGRRRYLRDIDSKSSMQRSFAERNAVNAPIQGSAADLIKLAMIDIFNEFSEKQLKSKMILQVHDELIFDVYKPELEKVQEIVKNKMENVHPLSVPLIIDMGSGNNWFEAH